MGTLQSYGEDVFGERYSVGGLVGSRRTCVCLTCYTVLEDLVVKVGELSATIRKIRE